MLHLPTLAEARSKPQACPKGASRLQAKVAARPLVQVNAETFKAAVWKRDKARCRCCGRKVLKSLARVPERGEVHHIHGRGKDAKWEDRAACLLCLWCHEQVTGRVNEKVRIVAAKSFRVGNHEYADARFTLFFVRIV